MKPILAALLAVLYVIAPAARADTSACYGVQDADARNYCLAKAMRDPSRCYAIQDPVTRAMCFGEVRR